MKYGLENQESWEAAGEPTIVGHGYSSLRREMVSAARVISSALFG